MQHLHRIICTARQLRSTSARTHTPAAGSSILSMWFGQSEQNVKQLFERARRQQPCVIFIDEVDSLLGRRSGGGGGGGGGGDSVPDKRVTNEFLSFIDGIQTNGADDVRITIMAATNNPWDLDEAALSRFSRRIYVPLPDKSTRMQMVRQSLSQACRAPLALLPLCLYSNSNIGFPA
jgi:SpoVK/Ycf46/Vps4 family AAA+-type ATPase